MPVAWTIKGEAGKAFVATEVTLASQSISGAVVEFRSLEADTLTLDYQLANYVTEDNLPELRQSVTLFRDGTRYFTGTVTSASPKISAASQTLRIVVSGPWWWLERIPMVTPQLDAEGNSMERPMYVFGEFATGGDMALYLQHAIDRSISLGAPMTRGTIAASFDVPRITLSQQMCGDVISELVRLIPDTVVWFDYSLYDYQFHPAMTIGRRIHMGAPETRTLTVGTSELTEIDVEPIIELEVSQVKVPYITRHATTGETQFATQDYGSASTGKVEVLPMSGPELVDFLPNDQLDTLKIEYVYDTDTAGLLAAVKWIIYPGWYAMAEEIDDAGGGDDGTTYGLSVANVGIGAGAVCNRNLSSGTSGGTTETFADAYTYTQAAFPADMKIVSFEENQQPPQWAIDDFGLVKYYPSHIWWWDGNLAAGGPPWYEQFRRYAIMDNTEWSIGRHSTANTSIDISGFGNYMIGIWIVDYKASVWLCPTANVPDADADGNRILIRGADFTFASPPTDFAKNLLAAQNWIPYQGTIRLSSADVGGTRYRGTKMNVIGSLSTMTDMEALVASETVNIAEGSTEITLGQAPRLDFIEFASRVRRTPQDNTNYITVAQTYNAAAKAYFDKCEDTDSFIWNLDQKAAISTFFKALVTAGIEAKIKTLHFYGANANVCLRNAMSPATVYAEWGVAPAVEDFKQGYCEIDGEDGDFKRTCAELGLAADSMGGFVTITGVPAIPDTVTLERYWMSSWTSGTANFQIRQDPSPLGELGARFCSALVKGQDQVNETDFDPARNGVFLGSRNGTGSGSISIINKTHSQGRLTKSFSSSAGTLPTPAITMLLGSGDYNVTCNLSIMGITTGLTQTEAEALADAAYDCAIGVGHTAVGTT
jgi:hypothetical protein